MYFFNFRLSERCAEVVKKQVPAPDEGMDDSEDEKENKANGDNNTEEETNISATDKETPETNGTSSESGDVAKKSKLEAEVAS